MNIPQGAKKVFSGKIFEVYQWEQKMYDGTTKIFERLKRPGTIQIIPTIGDNMFLSYEEQPAKPKSYNFLGGRQEEGEEPLATAKRELLEEAGFVSDDWELLKEYHYAGKIDWTTYLFTARNCRKAAEPHLDGGEEIEVKQVTWEEFLTITSREDFWSQFIASDILRMRLNPEKLEAFKKKLFPH